MSCDAENREQFRPEVHDTGYFLLTTVVGSYPKPKWLNRISDLTEDPDSKFIQEHLREVHDDVCRAITNEHERPGPDTVVDGRVRREETVEYFIHRIPGYEFNGPVKVWGHNYFDKPFVVSEVEHDEPWLVDEFEFTSDVASKPIKVPITGPYTLAGWPFNEHHDSGADPVYALADPVNGKIRQFVEVGATYTQIDESALVTTSDDHAIVGERLEHTVVGAPDEVRIGLHVCYGDYSRIYPELNNYLIDEFDVELCNGGYEQIDMFTDPEFEPDLALGVVDAYTAEVETVEEIKENIKQGLKAVPPEKLTVSPDCGVKLLPREVAYRKMENMVKAACEVEAGPDADEIDLDALVPQAD